MNEVFLKKAESFKPTICHSLVALEEERIVDEGESTVFDLGTHYVGYISLHFSSIGLHSDSPCLLKVKFAERKEELSENIDDYHGWISKSWIQEETFFVDYFPSVYCFKRRYACRYIKIEVIALSEKCRLKIDKVEMEALTSAEEKIEPVGADELDKAIDKVALKTLQECMQDVFEDGVKRDRRLWMGDLYLEAKANYLTYKHNDLVKRCLYLFAACADENGYLPQSVFVEPVVVGEEKTMFDYSLLFIATLYDYYLASNDKSTLEDLLPLAEWQIELAKNHFKDDVIEDPFILGWCFLDWSLELNKQAGAMAIYIFCEQRLVDLLGFVNKDATRYITDIEKKKNAFLQTFYDEESGLFTSGKERQISYATNIHAVLAGILSEDENKRILSLLPKTKKAIKPITPYLMHYYLEALCLNDMKKEAKEIMRWYYGGMVKDGADTFFELYNPTNKDESPYGGKAVNSYCHAWSCTPSYFLRKYFL